MFSTSGGKKKYFLIFFLLLVFLILSSRLGLTTPFNIVYPVVKIFYIPINKLSVFITDIRIYLNVKDENDKLKEENNILINENRNSREYKSENVRLREMLGLLHKKELKLQCAAVIGRDATSFFNTFIIDKGIEDGVKQNMAIVNNIGIIGKVILCTPKTSKVILITDSNCNISALDSRSRVYGLVSGTGGSMCIMKFVSADEDVKPGDTIISSGEGEIFPKGFLIGRVVRDEKSKDELMLDIYIAPAVKFSVIEEVFVVMN